MEGVNTQKSISNSNIFEIPVKDYEKDMESESLKEKKEVILDLFRNNNQLKSRYEFSDIKNFLHDACRKGDLAQIKILLCETIVSENLVFKIDKTNKTASLFEVNTTPMILLFHEQSNTQMMNIWSLALIAYIVLHINDHR